MEENMRSLERKLNQIIDDELKKTYLRLTLN